VGLHNCLIRQSGLLKANNIMWIITPIGFFSIVQKPADVLANTLTIRARVAADLEALRRTVLPLLGPVTESSYNDYRFRATAPRQAVAQAMSALMSRICYDNFKDEVARVQGSDRADLYHVVWSKLNGLQDDAGFDWNPQRALSRCAVPKASSYGGVLLNDQGQLLLREPTGHFGGYVWTFAKGRPELGESPQQTALREVAEEMGFAARIRGRLPDVYSGSTGTTVFFVMEPLGQPHTFQSETSETRWVSLDKASEMISQTPLLQGRNRDLQVLNDLRQWLAQRALHAT
jgi:8-oxo-dGTP pyrophosphatase MutT (NUDIX family)